MRNIALTLAYDGTRYFGWQKTKDGPSIEEEVEVVLERILQHPVLLQAASRTDRGVHASGQIVNFFTDKKSNLNNLQYGINALLPNDIRVMEAVEKPLDFHPTLDAISKEYHYKIAISKVLHPLMRFHHWHYPCEVDITSMRQAASLLIGKHDFSALRNERKGLKKDDTIRELLKIDIEQQNEIITMKMFGDNFLYKMARNIAGTLLYVGTQKIGIESIQEILKSKDRTRMGITAPAHGLLLYRIYFL